MSFEDFQRYLATVYISPKTGRPLGADASGDYPSRLRRLEKLTGRDVAGAKPVSLRMWADQLGDDPVVVDTLSLEGISDTRVALRRYADYLSLGPEGRRGGARGVQLHDAEAIVAELKGLGFSQVSLQPHVHEMQRASLIIYVKRLTAHQRIVVHPDFELSSSRLCSIPGVVREPQPGFFHDASMQRFPLRQRGDAAPVPYGLDFHVVDAEALRHLVHALDAISTAQEQEQADSPADAPTTETRLLRKARRGQGGFRADLLEYWTGTCPLTGVRIPELLRASHIKPWSRCTDRERLDPFNGLLLAAHFDALFDQGFISFTDEGVLLVAEALGAAEREVFRLAEKLPQLSVNPRHLPYLAHHREHVFLKS
ncbi:HNH endonuclease [Corallococcus coralloides]|uniref:HNH endonuclease n=1 Tax=Corallococcus coralloides TaxID=184914 RepID=UPI00384C2863